MNPSPPPHHSSGYSCRKLAARTQTLKTHLSSSEWRSDLFISIHFSIVKTIHLSITLFVMNWLPSSGEKARLELPLPSEILASEPLPPSSSSLLEFPTTFLNYLFIVYNMTISWLYPMNGF